MIIPRPPGVDLFPPPRPTTADDGRGTLRSAPTPDAVLKFGLFAHDGPPAPAADAGPRWATFSHLGVKSFRPKK
jgi:hypothetical protein